ncbi:MAG TPA: hypothetical protein VHQ86_05345, partial [Candidatus Saccharimonadia bacterium]|nr:hypothetical protein [Candidatus Saccharimonadia bacterium]
IVANNTAGAPSGNLLDLQKAGASEFSVDYNGNLTQAGGTSTTDTINGQTISSAASFTGTVTAATSVLTPLLDTASAGVLAVGTNNATAINLNQSTTVASGKNLTLAGGQYSQTYNSSAAGNGQTLSFTNSNTAGAGVVVQGIDLTPTNNTPASGTNTLNGVNFEAGSGAGANAITNGVNFASATGYTNFINTPSFVLSSSGAVTGLTGVSMASGNFLQSGGGTFTTGSGAVQLNGSTTIASGANLTLTSGSLTQTFSSAAAASAQTLSVTNSNSGASNVAVKGETITLTGTATSGGTNTNSALYFTNPAAAANNVFNGLNFAGTGYDNVLVVNGSSIINGSGVLQNAGFSGTYSNQVTLSNASNSFSGSSFNGLTLTSAADGFTVAGGTTPRTLTVTGADITIGSTIKPTSSGQLTVQSNGGNNLDIDAGGGASVNIAGTNANAVNVGNTTSNPSVAFNGSGSFGTTTGAVGLNGNTTLAAGKNLSTASGTGTITQNYSNITGTGTTLAATDSASSGTTTLLGEAINLTGTDNAGGSNTLTGLSFGNVTAHTNNTYYGIAFGTGLNDILRYNGTQLISGLGILQNAAIGSAVNYSNLTQVGALTSGSIASGFGTIATANTITGTTLNGTTGINTGAGAGTQRIDASGNLVAIGNITGAGAVTIATAAAGTLALQPAAGASLTGAVTKNAATGNEVAYDLATTINKATSGNYTGIKLNVTETSAPGAANLLADFQVGGTSKFSVGNTGIITTANVGTADSTTLLCRNSSNQIATCNGISLSGSAFIQGGNSFGVAGDLGTNDNFALNIRTNGTTKLTVGTNGDLTFAGSGVNGSFDQSASTGTFKTGSGAVTVNGATTVQPATGTNVFNVTAGAGGGSVLKVDSTNSRVGVNLGVGAFGLATGVNGLDVNGALRLGGGGGVSSVDSFLSPQGANVGSKINIPVYDPGANGQILAFGINGTNYNARGISVFDNRSTTNNQPAISVFSPDENNLVGFVWDGASTTAKIKTTGPNLNTTTPAIQLQSGDVTGGSGQATGTVFILSGSGSGTNTSSGNVTIDVGTKSGTGTLGQINIGATNVTAINIGRAAATTTINGVAQVGASAGTGALVNNGSTKNTSLALGDLAAGSIGTAATTVDVYTSFTISPTASGRTYTLPAPAAGAGSIIYISDINATNSFIIGSTTFNPHSTATLVYDGTGWNFAGMDGGSNNYIQNQNASDQTANFRISATGRANTSFTSPLFDSITGAVSLGGTTATGVTIGGTTNTTSIALQGAAAATYTIGNTNTTGTITVGQADATNTISIGSANLTAHTQTISIGNGTSTTSGGEVVNIANGVPGTGTTNSVAIGTAGTTTGTVNVTIGSVGGAAHTTVIQGGNGAGAVSVQAATSGTINIATAANTQNVLIGNATGGTIRLGQNGGTVQVDGTNFDVSTVGVVTL